MMKNKYLILLLLFAIGFHVNAQHHLSKLWETDTTLAEAESVIMQDSYMYVSLVDGQANSKDGKGGIAKVDYNGKIIDPTWVTGLNGPTGMGIWRNRLYVANIDEVVVLDTATAKIIKRISFPKARGLNDIAVDAHGIVYVSEPVTGLIYRIINDKPSIYLSGVPGVNGMQYIGDDLYMVTTTQLYRYNAFKKLRTVTAMPKAGADGLTLVGNGDLLFTIYTGLLYYLHRDGQKELLLNTEGGITGSADIGYDPVKQIVYVPTLFRSSIIAYRLK